VTEGRNGYVDEVLEAAEAAIRHLSEVQ